MSNYQKYLFAILFLILGTSTVSANVLWPGLYISAGLKSTWIIVGGLIVEIGFVKYFTKCNWLKTISISVIMNAATATVGAVTILFFDLGVLNAIWLVAYLIQRVMKFSTDMFFNAFGNIIEWGEWLLAYLFGIAINTLIEGGIIKFILKLKFKDTYKWLAVANAISIIMCAIYIAVGGVRL